MDEIIKSGEQDATILQYGSLLEGAKDSFRDPHLLHTLKVLEGRNIGATFQLINDNFFIDSHVLGRNPEYCEVVIDDNEVSSRHLEINVHSNSAYIRDLGSKNGTKLNGKKLRKRKELRHGDIITLGTTVLQFFSPFDGSAQTLISPPPVKKNVGGAAVFELLKTHYKPISLFVFVVVFIFSIAMLFLGEEKTGLSPSNNTHSQEASLEDRAAAKKNLQVALGQFKKGNYTEAIIEFENAFALFPALKKDHKVQYAEALLYESVDNYPDNLDPALASILKAVKVDSENYKSQYQLGRVYAKMRHYDKAGKAYERSIRLYDRFPDSHFNYAYILSLEGLYRQAIKKYEKIIPLKAEYMDEVYVNLAICYQRIARINMALQYAEKALAEDPQNKKAQELIKQYHQER